QMFTSSKTAPLSSTRNQSSRLLEILLVENQCVDGMAISSKNYIQDPKYVKKDKNTLSDESDRSFDLYV
ncbi:unnamed protein product, partial [Brachionus calyciflorus]